MQSLSQIGNARREERVLLPALIELRSEHGDEALAADGIDVSPSGIAVRAAFVPEVGTRLVISFRCPPDDDAVHGLGEVVWANWDGPRSGSFGMRFLELDTKSAKAIRRLVAPEAVSVEQPLSPRPATMRIEGLGAPIEADVRLYDKSCIVLEQELSFLRLGRGIEVDVPGRGLERGRIASIELRQGPLDTPTLVFGVLLDEKRELAVAGSSGTKVTAESVEFSLEQSRGEAVPERGSRPHEIAASAAAATVERRRADEPQVVRMRVSEPPRAAAELDEDDELERALSSRTPELWTMLSSGSTASLAWLRNTLWPALGTALRTLRALFGPRAAQGEQATQPSGLLLSLARARAGISRSWTLFTKRLQKRRTTAPAPRVQRSAASVRPQQRPEPARPARGKRWLTVSLAALGVGLGVYALAPRSGADRIRVPRVEPALLPARVEEPSARTERELPAPTVTAISTAAQSMAAEPPVAQGASRAPAALPADAPEPAASNTRFGEANVPNGRVFVLRMSGPVKSLEGDTREDGFSVRIPGRLALDRASPIATSHRAVARALILNRGDYAELTLEFLPGMRPKYQVVAKENSIEITLERL